MRLIRRTKEWVFRKYRDFGIAYLSFEPKAYERYGGRGFMLTYLKSVAMMPTLGFLFVLTNLASYYGAAQRDYVLECMDDNRHRFYGRGLLQAEVDGPYQGMFNTSFGYVTADGATGLKKTAEGLYVGPTQNELDKVYKNIEINQTMVEELKTLRAETAARRAESGH